MTMRPRLSHAIFILILCALGCGPVGGEQSSTTPSAEAVCAMGPSVPQLSVDPQVAGVGSLSQTLVHADEALWIVESGTNTVSRFDVATQTFEAGFVDVGNERNPYDIFIDEEAGVGFVTNYLANTVSVVNLEDGAVVRELVPMGHRFAGADTAAVIDHPVQEGAYRFDGPTGIAATEELLYVGNTRPRFEDGLLTMQAGTVTIIDRSDYAVVAVVETAAKNPQFITVDEEATGDATIWIADTGELAQRDGVYTQTSDAALERWRQTQNPAAPEREAYMIPAPAPGSRVGAPGRPMVTPQGDAVYLASATAPVVFKLDVASRAWSRGPQNPITLYETDTDALHNGFIDANGVLWVVAFNRDALYIMDTRCDETLAGPIDLGISPADVEGPIAIVVTDADAPQAYYMTSTSNYLGRVEGLDRE